MAQLILSKKKKKKRGSALVVIHYIGSSELSIRKPVLLFIYILVISFILSNRMDLLHSSAAVYEKGSTQLTFSQIIIFLNQNVLTVQVTLDFSAKYLLVERKGIIGAIVHKDSSAADVLQSYIHALVVAKIVDGNKSLYSESQSWMDEKYEVLIHKVLIWKHCVTFIWKVSFFYTVLVLSVKAVRKL